MPELDEGGDRVNAEEDASFREFARANTLPLRRTAYLLCTDWHLAEDLVQTALIKLYRAWRRVHRSERIDNYVRRILLRCWFDEQRRPWRRRERRDGIVPEPADALLDPAAMPGADGDRRAVASQGPVRIGEETLMDIDEIKNGLRGVALAEPPWASIRTTSPPGRPPACATVAR